MAVQRSINDCNSYMCLFHCRVVRWVLLCLRFAQCLYIFAYSSANSETLENGRRLTSQSQRTSTARRGAEPRRTLANVKASSGLFRSVCVPTFLVVRAGDFCDSSDLSVCVFDFRRLTPRMKKKIQPHSQHLLIDPQPVSGMEYLISNERGGTMLLMLFL